MKFPVSYFHLFMILRYLRGSKKAIFSLNAKLSFFGVFIGTSLLVVVLSIFNGFQKQVKESIFKFDPHLVIEKNVFGREKITNYRQWIEQINETLGDDVEKAGAMIQSAALMRINQNIDHIFIRATEFQPGAKKNRIALPDDFPRLSLKEDEKAPQDFRRGDICFIGKEMAFLHNLEVGDSIELVVPRGQFTAKTGILPSIRKMRIAGIFITDHYQYDSEVVILPLKTAQRLFAAGNSVQQLYVKLKSFDTLEKSRRKLNELMPIRYFVRTIEEEQRNFFRALKMEKTIMVVIVFLFILAAMAGIVVATFNVVRSRKKDIGILKALGVPDSGILFIFTLTGFLAGIAGTVLGITFGIFLSLNLENILNMIATGINVVGHFYHGIEWIEVVLVPKDIYYFDHLPVSIDVEFLHTLGVVSILLSGLAALIPAWYARKLAPIEIIRGADQ